MRLLVKLSRSEKRNTLRRYNKMPKSKRSKRQPVIKNKEESYEKPLHDPEGDELRNFIRAQQQEHLEDGTWVKCDFCDKYRKMKDDPYQDPSVVPNAWNCRMNDDPEYNDCSKPQDASIMNAVDLEYTAGTIVWVKLDRFTPWWPAMIDDDPDNACFYSYKSANATKPDKFNVVYFQENVERSWIGPTQMKPFCAFTLSDIYKRSRKCRELTEAYNTALMASSMTIPDRLDKFTFVNRYKGPIMGRVKDLLYTKMKNAEEAKKKAKQAEEMAKSKTVVDLEIQEGKANPQPSTSKCSNLVDPLGPNSEGYGQLVDPFGPSSYAGCGQLVDPLGPSTSKGFGQVDHLGESSSNGWGLLDFDLKEEQTDDEYSD